MSYDAIANWYDATVRGGLPVHALLLPALRELTGDVAGQRICDLGCGQGFAARQLAARGAIVTGIDQSARLLEIAAAIEQEKATALELDVEEREADKEEANKEEADKEEADKGEADWPPGIVYQWGDMQNLHEVADNAFDGVTCILALMDIEDLEAALDTVARILRPGGWFVFAITHPCYETPESRWTGKAGGVVKREVRGYFREGPWKSDNPHGVRGKVGARHRMLSTYLNALHSAGLILESLREPQAQDDVARRVPGYEQVPAVLAARCRKIAVSL